MLEGAVEVAGVDELAVAREAVPGDGTVHGERRLEGDEPTVQAPLLGVGQRAQGAVGVSEQVGARVGDLHHGGDVGDLRRERIVLAVTAPAPPPGGRARSR